jgi:hypothetical protein
MKNALLTLLPLALLAAFTPRAEAADYRRVFAGYDRCGRPVHVWVRESRDCAPRYREPRPCHDERSYSYRRPISFHDACSSSRRASFTSPRFSIRIGF